MKQRALVPLGQGTYSVSEVCRILQPTMTSRKVHYWLDTGLLSPSPILRQRVGLLTLLSFRQLLEIRTAQYMRDDLRLSLPRVRTAFEWVLTSLFAPSVSEVKFERGPRGRALVSRSGDDAIIEINSGQLALRTDYADLNATLRGTKVAWEAKSFSIPMHPEVVANARVQGGAPTLLGTRIETSLLATFADAGEFNDDTVSDVLASYGHLSKAAIIAAFEFEGMRRAA